MFVQFRPTDALLGPEPGGDQGTLFAHNVVQGYFNNFTFQLLDKLWSQVSSLLPLGCCLQFLSRIGFSNPTARRFFIECYYSRSRAFRKSICAQEKVATNLYEYALGGARTHETDLYQARG